jgi:hypothetical protein
MQTDAQLKGLLLAATLPIQRFAWEIDPAGARPEVVENIASSLKLPIRGQEPKPVRRRGFSWGRHLRHSLRSLAFGHMYFEQVYDWADPRKGGDGLLHLRKLATRPPRTIGNILVGEDGGLEGIVQNVRGHVPNANTFSAGLLGQPLDVDRLLAYIWDSEDDGDWTGRSMLRACFAHYLVKDRLIRVNATKHERNAMGIPWFEVDSNATQEQIDGLAVIAEELRAGTRAGGAGPGKLGIKGVEGTLPDVIKDVRYHDEQMAKAFIILFFNLGTTETGSRALGSEFIDWYTESQSGTADFIRDTTQEHQVEDQVALNFGPDEQPPVLSYTRLEGSEASIEDLKNMVDAGLIAVDDEVRSWIVQRYSLPAGAAAEPPPKPAPPVPPAPPPAPGQPPAPEPAPEPSARSVLAQRIQAACTRPMPWPDLARAVGRDPKDGTARRARDELVSAGILTKRQHQGGATVLAPLAAIQLPERELRRQPYDFEVSASVNFAEIDRIREESGETLVSAVERAQADQIDELAGAVEAAAGDAAELAQLTCEPIDADLVAEHLREAAEEGLATARAEWAAQQAPIAAEGDPEEADEDAIEETVVERAKAVAITLAAGLAIAASKRAASVSTLAPADAAANVRDYLTGLSGADLVKQLGGATMQALNTGRREFMRANDPASVYASELLDTNTCTECVAADGTEYPSVEASEADYPIGGNINCEGGLLCRGTVVAVY